MYVPSLVSRLYRASGRMAPLASVRRQSEPVGRTVPESVRDLR